ncbi:expressed unknown protein [Seminavis robusta]|uniref:Uncharacterized protein n=1 Tax=Seminavis robusta TaxID=568900 RepID=A0A9N8EX35_9STRA|nr:expressed unknown protein [Seminavis robusta]|eukprot:Sro1950_g307360.1 n/a (446) ;mRNA; f:4399-5736
MAFKARKRQSIPAVLLGLLLVVVFLLEVSPVFGQEHQHHQRELRKGVSPPSLSPNQIADTQLQQDQGITIKKTQRKRKRGRRHRMLQAKGRARRSKGRGRAEVFRSKRSRSIDSIHDARQGGRPVRCIVRGEPVVAAVGYRRRPNVGRARVSRRGGGSSRGRRDLQTRRQSRNEEYWPDVDSVDDCFFGVFAIPAGARVTRPPTPATVASVAPSVMPSYAPSVSFRPSVSSRPSSSTANFFTVTPGTTEAPSISFQPSVSASPSNQPSVSLTPSNPGATAAAIISAPTITPRNFPVSAVSRTISATLDFGFFLGAAITTPSNAELVGILQEIDEFFTGTISQSRFGGAFTGLQVDHIRTDFDPSQIATAANQDGFPVSLVIELVVNFVDGFGITVPTGDELVLVMEEANYVDFIESYAWGAEPQGGIFFETSLIQFVGVANGVRT